MERGVRGRTWGVAVGVAVVALVASACAKNAGGSSGGGGGGGGSTPAMSAGSIGTRSISSVGTVLVNGSGLTLYYLTTDKGGKVTCTGSCASTWPPVIVTSTPSAGSGVMGTLGTVTDPDGKKQLTYDGWPLYTYSGDSAPGQANGQGVGGVWFAMTPSGTTSSSPSPSPSSGGGGGYGGY